MSLPGMRSMSGTPPFKERLKQAYANSPSGSPAPYQSGGASHSNMGQMRMSSKTSMPKPPKPPEKPLMPYMRYSRKVWDSVKAKNPELRLWDIGKIIGQMWRELPDSEKREYNDAYESEKIQYQENLKTFHNSPVYQNYLREKQRAEHMIEEEERRSKASHVDQGVTIQPADYETDLDGGMSVKHVAAARYHRNHALINEIFSDTVVPDQRTVVTEQRMTVLKKQVNSLMDHQQKLERELSDINVKFEEKKRKFLESSEDFRKKLKEECDNKPVMTSAKFDALVIKHKAELRVRYEKMLEQQKQEQERQQAAAAQAAERAAQEAAQAAAKEESNMEKSEESANTQETEDSNPPAGDKITDENSQDTVTSDMDSQRTDAENIEDKELSTADSQTEQKMEQDDKEDKEESRMEPVVQDNEDSQDTVIEGDSIDETTQDTHDTTATDYDEDDENTQSSMADTDK